MTEQFKRYIDNYEDLFIETPDDMIELGWEGDILLNGVDKVVDLLNTQNKRIKELEEENASMKDRIINAMIESNQVECNCSTCVCEDYVNKELKKW